MRLNKQFYCKKSKASKKTGLAPIEVAVNVGGERSYITLELRAKPEQFVKDMASKKDNNTKSYCEAVGFRLEEIWTEMVRKGIPLTKDNLIAYYRQGGLNKIYTVHELFADFSAIKKEEYDAGQMKEITLKRYQKAGELFCSYSGLTGNENANTITIEHWKTFTANMMKKHKLNYVSNWQKKIRSAFKYAFESGKIDAHPFSVVKVPRVLNEIVYLTEEELDIIKKKVFKSDRLNRIKDVFLFQCFTALSYADLKGLVRDDFKQNKDKQWYIKKRRQKTGSEFVVVLLPNALEIVMEYNFCLPVISLTNYNKYLKEIGEICEIDKPFTTHLARRTGACYLLNAGVPVEVVAKTLGDSVKMVRQHYATLFDTTVFEEMKEVEEAQLSKLLGELLV